MTRKVTPNDESTDLQEPLLQDETLVVSNVNGIDNVASADEGAAAEENSNNNDNDGDDEMIVATEKDIVLPWCCCSTDVTKRKIVMNHNVFLNLLLAVLYGISGSLWNGTAYAAYLKKIGGDKNGPLGDIEAVSGLATLVTALPIGYLADRIGRSKVITVGGAMLLIATIMQIIILEWIGTDDDSFHHDSNDGGKSRHNTTVALWLLGLIMVFWGMLDGVVNGPCSALFADSTPEGERTKYYNYLFACYTCATATGPLVSIGLFQTLGDDWDLYDLRLVIYVGLSIELVNSILMMLFDDKKALEEPSTTDAVTTDDINGSNNEANNDDNCNEEYEAATNRTEVSSSFGESIEVHAIESNTNNNNTTEETEAAETPAGAEEEAPSSQPQPLTSLQKRRKWIPYIIFFQGLVMAIGSGMTVKFFPLFFKDEVGMSPSQVQIIYVLVPFTMVIISTLGSALAASGFGRVQTTILLNTFGVSCLYCMVFFKHYLDSHPFMLVPIYVLRTSLMNAPYPLEESILMDFVPKDERARWKSLDSVAAFGWCGSAALGGWLSDKFDYTYSFLITAILQTAGIVIFSLLLPLVPRIEGTESRIQGEDDGGDADADREHESEGNNANNNTTSVMQQPLLVGSEEG